MTQQELRLECVRIALEQYKVLRDDYNWEDLDDEFKFITNTAEDYEKFISGPKVEVAVTLPSVLPETTDHLPFQGQKG